MMLYALKSPGIFISSHSDCGAHLWLAGRRSAVHAPLSAWLASRLPHNSRQPSLGAGTRGSTRSALQRAPQDAVPRVGKFGNLFRRPGQRVIVDYQGDIVVRPSPHEIQLRSGARILRRPSH